MRRAADGALWSNGHDKGIIRPIQYAGRGGIFCKEPAKGAENVKMISIEEVKRAVVENFSMFDEWLDKYEYLIELGNKLEPFPKA